jgi:hypothetical protein
VTVGPSSLFPGSDCVFSSSFWQTLRVNVPDKSPADGSTVQASSTAAHVKAFGRWRFSGSRAMAASAAAAVGDGDRWSLREAQGL